MNTPLIPLVYLVYREVLSSVFPSQVLTPLEEMRERASVSLGLLTPVGQLVRKQHRPALQQIATRCRQSGIDVGWLPSPPSRTPWLWSKSFVLRQWISKRFTRDQSFIVRCRGMRMTVIAIDALKSFQGAQVVFDCRGSELCEAIQEEGLQNTPESQWSRNARMKIEQARDSERIAVTRSAGVTCVSNAMIRMLQARYPEVPAKRFLLVPCCTRVDTFTQAAQHRDSLRRELGLQDKFVVTYLGSLNWIHLPEQMIRVFRIIRHLIPKAHFLAITTDPQKMQAFLAEAGLTPAEFTIRTVPQWEVPRWLVISDLGLSLLKTNERDRVCSPLKIAEYFSAGTPVVMTPQQGDYSAILNSLRLGVEVDLEENDAQLTTRLHEFLLSFSQDSNTMRARCTQYAEAELSWSGVIPRLSEWYRELLDLPPQAQPGSGLSASEELR